ncbi:MAG: type II toxin-antitoxin system mRNA interferase toxin, RelE/StbE family [Nanoarchaeota archaeon]|nr:type II toxin-antitoxin system mRNA interferase toxin, RelE/StbE family [Nanoarchaeota archaeon]
MVAVVYDPPFKRKFKKIKDKSLKTKIYKQIAKIIKNPETGKPMMHTRKGTREVYISPFRLSYSYLEKQNTIVFLELYHKDEQ